MILNKHDMKKREFIQRYVIRYANSVRIEELISYAISAYDAIEFELEEDDE